MNNETLSKAADILGDGPKRAEYWTPIQWHSPRSGTRWTENGDCVRVMRFDEEVDSITTSERLEHIRRALDGLAKTSFR